MTESSGVPFTHEGATLVAEEHPGEPRAPAIVLVHGIGMGRSVFADLIAHLQGLRIVAIDLPGYGEAPEPPRTPTIERMADLLAAWLRAERLPDATLLGHSMGTQVVAEVAARHPDVVDRVVLVAPTVNPRDRTALRQLALLARDLLVESPIVFVRGGREYLRAGPHLRRKVRAMIVHRVEATLPRVHRPALVLRGADDPVAPADWCREVVALLPDATFAEIPAHGHETLIRDAAPAASLIRAFVDEA